jgi:phage terminase large subunit-like protein
MTREQAFDISKLSRDDREVLVACLATCMKRHEQRLFYALYPDEDEIWRGLANKHFNTGATIYARHLYPKHLEFFRVGAKYRERCLMAANRTGKTLGGGGYETACHLTGLYPPWWEGRRFEHPTRAWVAGKTNETTRDIIQDTLLGEVAYRGQRKVMSGKGVVPGDLLGAPSWKQGVQDLVDTIKVRHVSGGWSQLGFKAYNQGRGSFEGESMHVIWLDEEPPMDVYGECLIRTATTGGIIMLTFTPLMGMSEVVLQFMPTEFRPGMGD